MTRCARSPTVVTRARRPMPRSAIRGRRSSARAAGRVTAVAGTYAGKRPSLDPRCSQLRHGSRPGEDVRDGTQVVDLVGVGKARHHVQPEARARRAGSGGAGRDRSDGRRNRTCRRTCTSPPGGAQPRRTARTRAIPSPGNDVDAAATADAVLGENLGRPSGIAFEVGAIDGKLHDGDRRPRSGRSPKAPGAQAMAVAATEPVSVMTWQSSGSSRRCRGPAGLLRARAR